LTSARPFFAEELLDDRRVCFELQWNPAVEWIVEHSWTREE
jgi:hypothetical protein